MTEKLFLQLALVLPSVPDERDACIARLTDALQAQGLEKVHFEMQDRKPALCLHLGPAKFNLSKVRRMTQAAGSHISARYRRCAFCGFNDKF